MKHRFVYIAFALSVIILIWLGRIYYQQNNLQIRYTKDVEHTYQVIISLRNCEQLLAYAESSQRGYLLTHVDQFLEIYKESIERIDSSVKHLTQIISDNASQRVNIKLLMPVIKEKLESLSSNLNVKKSDKLFIERMKRGKLAMDKIRFYITMMEKEEYTLLQYRNQIKDRYQQLNFSFLKYTFSFALLICVGSMLLIIRELRMRIRSQKMLEHSMYELNRNAEEIEQVSFAASHDLQEPLRKIRTLSTLLTKKYADSFSTEEKDILYRIDRSTERMHGLLENLIDFTNLIKRPDKIALVNLDKIFVQSFNKVMSGEDVALEKMETLPVIKGYEQQISILFIQLLSNSLRYSQPGRKLLIRVTYEIKETKQKGNFWSRNQVTQYHAITLQDNGIGFDNTFREKIFILFQRLHNHTEYAGKGIGLTIARRIMTNHYGYIEASGDKDAGAVFTLCFPLG